MTVVQSKPFKLEAWQTNRTANSASYKMKVSRRNGYFWGHHEKAWIQNHNGRVFYWNAPSTGSDYNHWRWNGRIYYIIDANNVAWDLNNKYWPGATASDTHKALDSWESPEYTVPINRGNAKSGSTTITVGIFTTYTDIFKTLKLDLPLYTSEVANISNISFTGECDDRYVQNRYIRLRASYTNPENFYHATITGPGLNETFDTSYSKNIAVTNAMHNTTRTYTITIKGDDGVVYKTQSVSVYIEPSGVGIWYKQNNKPKECYHVYYKNNQGNIIEVTEAWYKRNSQNIKTVK